MLKVELELEANGRWIAEVPELPGVLAHGVSREEAVPSAKILALRVLAERLEHGQEIPLADALFSIPADYFPDKNG